MCFVVDLFNLRHRLLFIALFVTCVCVKVISEYSGVAFFFFVTYWGYSLWQVVNALVLLQKSETVYFVIVVGFTPLGSLPVMICQRFVSSDSRAPILKARGRIWYALIIQWQIAIVLRGTPRVFVRVSVCVFAFFFRHPNVPRGTPPVIRKANRGTSQN